MRISGTEPSSVPLRQREFFKKLKSGVPKMPKTNGSQKEWCNKPQNFTISINFNTTFLYPKTLRINQRRPLNSTKGVYV